MPHSSLALASPPMAPRPPPGTPGPGRPASAAGSPALGAQTPPGWPSSPGLLSPHPPDTPLPLRSRPSSASSGSPPGGALPPRPVSASPRLPSSAGGPLPARPGSAARARRPSLSTTALGMPGGGGAGECAWDVYVAHRAASAWEAALALKAQLEAARPGARVLADPDDDDGPLDAQEALARVDDAAHFVLVLSQGALESPRLTAQLRRALARGRPVAVVHDERSCRFPTHTEIAADLKGAVSASTAIPYYRDVQARRVTVQRLLKALNMDGTADGAGPGLPPVPPRSLDSGAFPAGTLSSRTWPRTPSPPPQEPRPALSLAGSRPSSALGGARSLSLNLPPSSAAASPPAWKLMGNNFTKFMAASRPAPPRENGSLRGPSPRAALASTRRRSARPGGFQRAEAAARADVWSAAEAGEALAPSAPCLCRLRVAAKECPGLALEALVAWAVLDRELESPPPVFTRFTVEIAEEGEAGAWYRWELPATHDNLDVRSLQTGSLRPATRYWVQVRAERLFGEPVASAAVRFATRRLQHGEAPPEPMPQEPELQFLLTQRDGDLKALALPAGARAMDLATAAVRAFDALSLQALHLLLPGGCDLAAYGRGKSGPVVTLQLSPPVRLEAACEVADGFDGVVSWRLVQPEWAPLRLARVTVELLCIARGAFSRPSSRWEWELPDVRDGAPTSAFRTCPLRPESKYAARVCATTENGVFLSEPVRFATPALPRGEAARGAMRPREEAPFECFVTNGRGGLKYVQLPEAGTVLDLQLAVAATFGLPPHRQQLFAPGGARLQTEYRLDAPLSGTPARRGALVDLVESAFLKAAVALVGTREPRVSWQLAAPAKHAPPVLAEVRVDVLEEGQPGPHSWRLPAQHGGVDLAWLQCGRLAPARRCEARVWARTVDGLVLCSEGVPFETPPPGPGDEGDWGPTVRRAALELFVGEPGSGGMQYLQMPPGAAVADVQAAVEPTFGIPRRQQRLLTPDAAVLRGKALLSESPVAAGAVLTLQRTCCLQAEVALSGGCAPLVSWELLGRDLTPAPTVPTGFRVAAWEALDAAVRFDFALPAAAADGVEFRSLQLGPLRPNTAYMVQVVALTRDGPLEDEVACVTPPFDRAAGPPMSSMAGYSLFVTLGDGRATLLQMEAGATCHDLKRAVDARFGIAPFRQRLLTERGHELLAYGPGRRELLLSESPVRSGEVVLVKNIYGANARAATAAGAKLDANGNAIGSEFDLAPDGAFEGKKIGLLNQTYRDYRSVGFKHAFAALAKKGFEVLEWKTEPPPAGEFAAALAGCSQFWLLSATEDCGFTEAHLDAVDAFFRDGRGVYIWGDDEPKFRDANRLAARLLGEGARLFGDEPGDRKVALAPAGTSADMTASCYGPPGIVPGHLISTGLSTVYEGATISTVDRHPVLKALIRGSAGNVVTAVYEAGHRRAVVDGGFTRLMDQNWVWNQCGTDRYLENAACWLVNAEHNY